MSYLLHEAVTGERESIEYLKLYLSLALCDDITKTVWDVFSMHFFYITFLALGDEQV